MSASGDSPQPKSQAQRDGISSTTLANQISLSLTLWLCVCVVIFQSYIVEIHEAGRRYKLTLRFHTVQRVQFVYGLSKLRHSYLLFFLDKEFVHLYQITCRQRKEGGVRITQQPNLESIVARRHMWLQYDTSSRLLYILMPVPKNSRAASLANVKVCVCVCVCWCNATSTNTTINNGTLANVSRIAGRIRFVSRGQ
jgi:hypothetical protein